MFDFAPVEWFALALVYAQDLIHSPGYAQHPQLHGRFPAGRFPVPLSMNPRKPHVVQDRDQSPVHHLNVGAD